MPQAEFKSAIERLLGFDFVSDPRLSRYPIPETPADFLAKTPDMPYPHASKVISPDMARDILKYRVIRLETMPRALRHKEITGNRRFLIASLKGSRHNPGLIHDLTNDLWNPRIASPIVFTADGFLLDGQHRVAACALSNVPLTAPITTNGQWDTFSVTDIGRARNAGQLLGDIPYPDLAAATAKLILPVLNRTEESEWSVPKASNQDVYDLVHGWPFFQEDFSGEGVWLKHVSQAAQSRIPMSPLAASTMMALAAGADAFYVAEFLEGLKPGYKGGFPEIGPDTSDPRFLLRRAYLSQKSGRVGADDKRKQVGHVRRAMQVWLDYCYGTAKLPKLSTLSTVSKGDALPAVWRADEVRSFHAEKVS